MLTNSYLSATHRSVRKIGIIRQSRAVLLYFSDQVKMQTKVKDTLVFKYLIIK